MPNYIPGAICLMLASQLMLSISYRFVEARSFHSNSQTYVMEMLPFTEDNLFQYNVTIGSRTYLYQGSYSDAGHTKGTLYQVTSDNTRHSILETSWIEDEWRLSVPRSRGRSLEVASIYKDILSTDSVITWLNTRVVGNPELSHLMNKVVSAVELPEQGVWRLIRRTPPHIAPGDDVEDEPTVIGEVWYCNYRIWRRICITTDRTAEMPSWLWALMWLVVEV